MTVVIKSVEEHGKLRWVRVKCPDCGTSVPFRATVNESNESAVRCHECLAKFTATWEESDESMT